MFAEKEVVKSLVKYFGSEQWTELMTMLTETEEELYHIHMNVQNSVAPDSLSKLFEKYFELKGLPLDRKIDILCTGEDVLAVHNIHPHNPERALYTPHADVFWKYNPSVVIEPSDPKIFGEGGKNIQAWGKRYMDDYYGKFDFKCVGPYEEREIAKYFQSTHWKKGLRLIEDPLYGHVHINVEINFDPWILKVFAIDAFKEIGWTVDHVVPCVFIGVGGDYQGKMVFLGAYPEEVYDIAWVYNPEVVISRASSRWAGFIPEDGDVTYSVCNNRLRDEFLAKNKHITLTDEQIEQILKQV